MNAIQKLKARFSKMAIERLTSLLGESVYIHNGQSWFYGGGDKYLLDNQFLKIGFGEVVSGYGDWGGGFSHSKTNPLKIFIDKNFIIQKVETDGFYNQSKEYDQIERLAEKVSKRFKIGDKFDVHSEELNRHIKEVFEIIDYEGVIGYEFLESPHMLKHYKKEYEKQQEIKRLKEEFL